MSISSIDDLLAGVGNSQQPPTPEYKAQVEAKTEIVENVQNEVPSYDESENVEYHEEKAVDNVNEENQVENKPESQEVDVDDYGNTKERMSDGMRERLDRKEKQHQRELEQHQREIDALRMQLSQQGASPQIQQAARDFKYDPNDDSTWQQQLSEFVKHTVTNMHNEDRQRQEQIKEQQVEREFHQKFTQGMERFNDFREVVGAQPIDNAMTLALRGMTDPSAFIYAASKRQPGELERISKLQDPYARIAEMGKLEERMRRNKPTTQAPRPLGRTREDATSKPAAKQEDSTGDDLLSKADAKRMATVKNRLKANR